MSGRIRKRSKFLPIICFMLRGFKIGVFCLEKGKRYSYLQILYKRIKLFFKKKTVGVNYKGHFYYIEGRNSQHSWLQTLLGDSYIPLYGSVGLFSILRFCVSLTNLLSGCMKNCDQMIMYEVLWKCRVDVGHHMIMPVRTGF